PPEARASHLLGTVRLIRLVMAREFKSMRRDLAVNVQAEIVYRGLPAHPLHPGLGTGRDLRDDLLDRVIAAVFLEDRDALRDEAAFQARLAGSRAGMGLPAQEIARTVQATLERLARVLAALPRVAAATA